MDEDLNVVAAAADDDDYSEKSRPNLPTAFSMFSSIPGSSSGSSRTSERKKEKNKNKKKHMQIFTLEANEPGPSSKIFKCCYN